MNNPIVPLTVLVERETPRQPLRVVVKFSTNYSCPDGSFIHVFRPLTIEEAETLVSDLQLGIKAVKEQ